MGRHADRAQLQVLPALDLLMHHFKVRWREDRRNPNGNALLSVNMRAQAPEEAYLNLLAGVLTGSAVHCAPETSESEYMECMRPFRNGLKWPAYGTTMAGHRRLRNVRHLLLQANASGLKGSYAECGVWRGGMSIYAKAVLEVYHLQRQVYLCDSFQGLPKPRAGSLRSDETHYSTPAAAHVLSQGEAHVASNFRAHGVPFQNVTLVKGFFVDALPAMRAGLLKRGETLSILRLDGDMYDSTIDILYNLYDLVDVGGYVVVDDFGWDFGTQAGQRAGWGAKDALLDFRAVHGIEDRAHRMRDIDGSGAWFQKARQVQLGRRKYLEAVARSNYTALQPSPRLTAHDYLRYQRAYDRLADSERA